MRDRILRNLTRFLALSAVLAAPMGCADPESPAASSSSSGGAAGAGAQGGTGGAGASGGATTSSTGAAGAEPGTTTLTAQMGPITIQSGEEAVKCVVVGLGNAESVFVRKFRTNLAQGSHHMIAYLSNQAPNPAPFPCQTFAVQGGSAIFIAEQAHSELSMPDDPSGVPVGLKLAPNQSLTLEMHYINTTAAALDVVGTIEMDVLPLTTDVIESGFSFRGQLGIPVIPAQGEADTGVRFEPGLPGAHVFALTTHQHHLGTEMQVWYSDNINDLSHRVADSTSWADPPLELFDPPLEFPAGGSKGFAYQCHWKNPTPYDVSGGLSANDEMCFFWNYYYPAGG